MKFSTAAVALLGALAGVTDATSPNDHPAPSPPVEEGSWPTIIWHPSGYIKLGVRDAGQLNLPESESATPTSSVSGEDDAGMRYIDKDGNFGAAGREFESTSQGCECEGFGVAYESSDGTFRAQANNNYGTTGLTTPIPMLHSSAACMGSVTPGNCNWAETKVTTANGCLQIEHKYHPSEKTDLAFKVDVVLTNLCDAPITALRYQRSMDWDTDPTPFDEIVFLNPGDAADLACLHDNGFCGGNPDSSCVSRFSSPSWCAPSGGGEVNTLDDDHGATFRFSFQEVTAATPLNKDESYSFVTYYGAGKDKDEALAAMGLLGDVEAYSIAISAQESSPAYFFGFAGVGGSIEVPPIIPGDVFRVPCECEGTTVSTDTTSATLEFDVEGPYDAECV